MMTTEFLIENRAAWSDCFWKYPWTYFPLSPLKCNISPIRWGVAQRQSTRPAQARHWVLFPVQQDTTERLQLQQLPRKLAG